MFNYLEDIRKYIDDNYIPAAPDNRNISFTSHEFLNHLFNTFPQGCINDYELNEILISLDFKRYDVTTPIYPNKDAKDQTIRYTLTNSWCLISKSILKAEKENSKT